MVESAPPQSMPAWSCDCAKLPHDAFGVICLLDTTGLGQQFFYERPVGQFKRTARSPHTADQQRRNGSMVDAMLPPSPNQPSAVVPAEQRCA